MSSYDGGFEYGSLWVNYGPFDGSYRIRDNTAGFVLGWIRLDDGPGWVLYLSSTIRVLMEQDLHYISELLSDLNGELSG